MPKIFYRADLENVIKVKEDKWFKDQQLLLLQMVNTEYGKDLLCIPKSYKNIFKFGKNHVFYNPRMEGGVYKYDWDFRIGAKWANVIRKRWEEFQGAALFFQSQNSMKPVVLTGSRMWAFGGPYYPDPDVEVTSVDGTVNGSDVTWATVRDATSGDDGAEDTGVDTNQILRAPQASLSAGVYYIARSFVLFDTAAIPDTDTISAATLSLFGTSTVGDADTTNVDIVSSTPASNTALVAGDFDQIGSTVFADKALSAWSTSAYNDFVLATPDDGKVSKTGVSKFATRNSRDTDNSAPTGANTIVHICADTAGTTQDPKLSGTSAAPATASNITALLMRVG